MLWLPVNTVDVYFKYDGGEIGKGALVTLSVGGQKVAERKLTRSIPFRVSADETLDIGEDTGTPASEDYHVPFKFTGTINKVMVKLSEASLSPRKKKRNSTSKRVQTS
jgi:hypothetical protein